MRVAEGERGEEVGEEVEEKKEGEEERGKGREKRKMNCIRVMKCHICYRKLFGPIYIQSLNTWMLSTYLLYTSHFKHFHFFSIFL